MKTLTAKFPGKCSDCGEPIHRGDTIAWLGHGTAQHIECYEESRMDSCEDEVAGLEPGTLDNDRSLAKRGLSVSRFSNGEVMTRNSKGRCEDAPCCGCCT